MTSQNHVSPMVFAILEVEQGESDPRLPNAPADHVSVNVGISKAAHHFKLVALTLCTLPIVSLCTL